MSRKLQGLVAKAEKAAAATFLYFAYGSNMDLAQIKSRCPSARLVGRASLAGYTLAFGGFSQRWGGSVATVLQSAGGSVQGLLFDLRCDCILKLDRFEGHPFAYKREAVVVRDGSGRKRKAFTYLQPRDGFESWPPPAEYFTQIFEAYVKHDLDISPLIHAAHSRLFVYGSLMQGFGNHRLLQGARFIGTAQTVAGFRLHALGGYPGLVSERGMGSAQGEVYEVDGDALAAIDKLEGHPRFYRRTLIRLADGTFAETYLLKPHQVEGAPLVASGDWRSFKNKDTHP